METQGEQGVAVEVRGLVKRFRDVCAVDHLSFSVNRSEIFGLVGPDGAGKTTTLRMLAAVLTPDEGTATVAGLDVVRHPDAAKQLVSYMPQRFGLYEELTIDENIRFYADIFGVPSRERKERASRLLAIAGLEPFRTRQAGRLSGGMKQKLGLVCALIHTPRIILLDEPTNGVDPISRRDFWSILYSLATEGVTVIASTAYLDEAERCHRVALLHKGGLLFCDTPSQLKKKLPGDVVAVISTDARRLRGELEHADGVSSLVLVGDGVHLLLDDAERRIPELRSRLTAAKLAFDHIVKTTPTVEDVMVAAVEGKTGNAR
ncbi:MAG: ABC transporter ATP-binding protein [Acidobacteriia bacterium]|nr:ABC transporter ATP-binding protein [Terriglobia bacterium]